MALVNGGFLHLYVHEEILKKSFSPKPMFRFLKKNSQKYSLSDLSQKLLGNFDPSLNMALVNGGYFHYTDMN